MSSKIYWEPVPEKQRGGYGIPLKDILRERFSPPAVIGNEAAEFLQGVAAANEHCREEVEELLEAIDKYGRIRLEERG